MGVLQASNLIALVHFDADLKAASVVSILGNAEVNIPGHAPSELENALAYGGPALLIDTVQQLANVPIDYYSVAASPTRPRRCARSAASTLRYPPRPAARGSPSRGSTT